MEAVALNKRPKSGPIAPKDPIKKRPYFFIMQGKEIYGAPMPDKRGIQFIFEDSGRLIDSAKITGNVKDQEILELLRSAKGFRRLVHSVGVSVSSRVSTDKVHFVLQMYGEHQEDKATELTADLSCDGMEYVINLEDIDFMPTDKEVGQIRFEFDTPGIQATTDVCFYLNDGFTAPPQTTETSVDFASDNYKKMIERSLMYAGNVSRLEKVFEKAGSGEELTLAFIGGSITQGAGAVPLHERNYARVFTEAFEKKYSQKGKVKLVKAGVGGTPSELGMIRFERDILRHGQERPDIIVIEFAVNDEGDETKGVCYESLVRKALSLPWHPAVVLLFAVFSFDWNLQDRLGVVGTRYNIPMVSIMDAVTPQFSLLPEDGRVISKNQFFYDQYHPSNLGHRVMADCLLNLMDAVNEGHCKSEGEERKLSDIRPAIGNDFDYISLLDRKELPMLKERYRISGIELGDFADVDKEVQMAELDYSEDGSPQFPYNWAKTSSESTKSPFRMKALCSKLLLVFKDSGSPEYGTAEVYVDGKLCLVADPLVVGWTHCNALIVLNEKDAAIHEIKVSMKEGFEDKKFTILGFGIA
ncbi:SGNH/GDSL hydrolase family protein [Butyrivibrio proteoclasticus]|uniref:SGNH/GDSL hydrolase family protein n=1 Tax=Butyrivibrio proteoclasticus TaxID=43305 RepID=UPI00047AE059|nr:SGNH/GDSL hydrolase family protein [Butyrivibrio proteoclasticus]